MAAALGIEQHGQLVRGYTLLWQNQLPDWLTSSVANGTIGNSETCCASLGLKVAITEADVRTFVNNETGQGPTDHLATFAQPDEFGQMLKACLAVRQCISFTVWGFGDADSWVPGFLPARGTPRFTT